MAQDSKISWCRHTANLWWGCVEVSKLCDFCYARDWAKRYDRAKWGANEPRVAVKGVWADLAKYQKMAAAAGRIDAVFVGSMMDIFEKSQPVIDHKGQDTGKTTQDLRRRFFGEVVPASPNLYFLALTKRPGNITAHIPDSWKGGAPGNVMFGTSVGDQETSAAVEKLKSAPGRRFLSCEPLLGPIDFGDGLSGIHWVITGCESGPKRRPMDPAWDLSIEAQCRRSDVPFFRKQIEVQGVVSTHMDEWPEGLRVRQAPEPFGKDLL